MEMLEIRLRELYHVVDRFIILESNHTFTGESSWPVVIHSLDRHSLIIGHEKPLYLTDYIKQPQHHFQFAADKMEVHGIQGRNLSPGEDPFAQEGHTRGQMNRFLIGAGIRDGDILIVSDVDEIPRSQTVELFRQCQGPDIVHLDMTAYVYSFGFKNHLTTWKASLHRYRRGHTGYGHGLQSPFRLMNAGWHCSFCFGHINQFLFKMAAYSHAERGHRHPKLMTRQHVQDRICRGQGMPSMTDIF